MATFNNEMRELVNRSFPLRIVKDEKGYAVIYNKQGIPFWLKRESFQTRWISTTGFYFSSFQKAFDALILSAQNKELPFDGDFSTFTHADANRSNRDNGWIAGDVKAELCPWLFASGICGISNNLFVFDGDSCVGTGKYLDKPQRTALAEHMIQLWKRFAEYH